MGNHCCAEGGVNQTAVLMESGNQQDMVEPVTVSEKIDMSKHGTREEAQKEVKNVQATAPKEVETPPEKASDPDTHPVAKEVTNGSVFFASIEKTADTKLGLGLESMPDGPSGTAQIVTSVAPGSLIDVWNQANPEKAVQVHDRLASVNGDSITPIEKIKDVKDAPVSLEMGFLRPKSITFSLQKMGKPLGLKLHKLSSDDAVYIMNFTEGVFEKTATLEGVKPGDRIVSVNGRSDSSAEMMRAVVDSDPVELHILSY